MMQQEIINNDGIIDGYEMKTMVAFPQTKERLTIWLLLTFIIVIKISKCEKNATEINSEKTTHK